MDNTTEEFIEALQQAIQLVPIQVRQPSYNASPFWGNTLTVTRARPLAVSALWQDLLVIPKLADHARVIDSYVASCQNEGMVQFRWTLNGGLLDPQTLQLTAGVDLHLDRTAAHPYPCANRSIYRRFGSTDNVTLQALNLDAGVQLAFGAVYGWYYPSLGSSHEITNMEGIDDVVRS